MFRENDRDVEVLFGVSNAKSLAERPCWVYVLERRRAVEVLKTLMGDEDPDSARQINANTLRALYGVSKEENAIFGSPDAATAEDQISILFASSPPLRSVDLPDCLPISFGGGSQAITTHILTELNEQNGDLQSSPNSAPSVSSKAASTTGLSSKSSKGFRARPIPATTIQPSIQPRMSHAAALRAGLVKPVVTIWHKNPRQPLSKEEQQHMFVNVPGHKRSETLSVPSTAPPAIPPRMTRAASLRQGIKDLPSSSAKPRVRDPEAERKVFDGVPGHKRRETITVASVQPPVVAPRPNRAATLRAERERPPPSSYMFRTPSNSPKTPRSSSSLLVNPPSDTRPNSAIGPRPSSATLARPSSVTPSLNKRASVIPVPASLKKPTVEPRQNKSALLRAKKLEGARDGSGRINGKPVFV
ncbi:hypothetical protein Clacol_007525 [Clathrus columnatus]|uniref:Nucleoside diphosphate kinase n=1 Tax=Clathrus columnatus TaxID=1419009 RepID=A0AAV5AF65_9AGAM|nr:hypothetical protein Clacol_007525 [Clathrus columnatus]